MLERISSVLKYIKKRFKKYFSTNILFLTYTVTSVLIAFLLRFITNTNPWSLKALICDLTFVVIIGAFGYLIKPKNQFKYFFTLSCFYTFLCIGNNHYYTFYNGYMSASLLGTLSMIGQVKASALSKIKVVYLLYLLAPVIMLIVNKRLIKKNYYYNVGKEEKGKAMFIKTSISGMLVVLILIVSLSSAEKAKLSKLWSRDYIALNYGLYAYTIADLVESIVPSINPMRGFEDAAEEFIKTYGEDKKHKTNEYTNIFEGKNILFIHGESIQNFLIDLKVNDIEITPFLNKLSKEGMYFSSFYPQISVGTSSDSEFTLSTGILPSTNGTVFINYYDRTYDTIQKAFKEKGYYTFSMHANNREYWNREVMYKTLGYDRFYAKDDFVVNEEDIIGLGLNDKSFYTQIIPYLKEIKQNNNNYMGLIISLTNHSPFNDVLKYGDLDFSITFNKDTGLTDEMGRNIYEEVTVPYLENTQMGNYLKSAHYADEAYKLLFDLLEDNGLLDNTVIVFYGDHESKLGKEALNLLYNYDPLTDSIKDKDDATYISLDNYKYDLLKNTPLIIWTKDNEVSGEIKDVMGMWDVYPTLSNMFNINCKYALGNDIFSDEEKIVVFPGGDILTNKVFYNNSKDEYVMISDEAIDNDYMTKYIERINEYASSKLEVSKGIVRFNLIEKLK